jgi:putative transcriptional regulator
MAGEDEYDQPEQTSAPDLCQARSLPGRLDVAAIRRQTGLSHPAFARRIDVSLATLRNWEQGDCSPTGPGTAGAGGPHPLIIEETLTAKAAPSRARKEGL